MSYPRDFGLDSYAEYLDTDHWHQCSQEALTRAGHKCALCGSPERLVIHHNTYDLFHETPADTCVLCAPCHEAHHEAVKARSFVPKEAIGPYERNVTNRDIPDHQSNHFASGIQTLRRQ